MAKNINDYSFIFTVRGPNSDEPNKLYVSQPVTLGEIIEHGSQAQLDFVDGSNMQFEDIEWGVDEVTAELVKGSKQNE
jgi:hypothetical protein